MPRAYLFLFAGLFSSLLPALMQQLPPMGQVILPLPSVVQHVPIFWHSSPQHAGAEAWVAAGLVVAAPVSARTEVKRAPAEITHAATSKLNAFRMEALSKKVRNSDGDAAVPVSYCKGAWLAWAGVGIIV